MSLGKKIRELRKSKGLSQVELALACHVFQNTISNFENEIATPGALMIKKLADALGVSVDFLLGKDSVELRNAELVELLKEVDKLPSDQKNAILLTIRTLLDGFKVKNKSRK